MTGRKIETVRITCNGAGAAAIACLNLLVSFGASKDNILVCDRKGVIHAGRTDLDQYKGAYAAKTEARSLADAMKGADIFLGLSAKDSVTQDMVKSMAAKPIIFAMANPDPEIRPELVHEVRDDAIVATGRSDYPNQVNNVLCFPFIFRGALDCGATEINEAMKRACAEATRASFARIRSPSAAWISAIRSNTSALRPNQAASSSAGAPQTGREPSSALSCRATACPPGRSEHVQTLIRRLPRRCCRSRRSTPPRGR